MVQRNDESSVNYFTSIIQWIHNNPSSSSPSPHQQRSQQTTFNQKGRYDNKTNPRQQLLSCRHLKRNRHKASRSLPEFEQEDIVTDTKLS